MKKRPETQKKLRFRFCNGIYLSYSLLVFVIMLAFFAFNYDQTQKTIVSNMYDSLSGSQRQASTLMKQKLEALFHSGNMIYVSSAFTSMRPLTHENKRDNAADILMYYDVKRTFDTIVQSYGECDLRIYVHDNVLFANEQELFYPISLLENCDWYTELKNTNGRQLWYYDTSGTENAILCVRLVYQRNLPFVIYSGLPISAFAETMVSPFEKNGGLTLLYNGEESVFSDITLPELRPEDKENLDRALREDASHYIDLMDQRYMFSQTDLHNGKWRLISLVPEQFIMADIRGSVISGALFIAVCLLSGLFMVILLGNIFARRIRELVRHMEHIRPDDLCDLIHVTGNSEISLIENKFNAMILRLRSLIKEIDTTNTLKRKAELRALQAQINPHFLYNTLDTINWMAIDAKEFQIAEMVSSLGHFYYLSLSDGRDIITVGEEVEIAREYANLLRMRNEDALRIHFDVHDDCLRYCCVKLLIQPLLENAVKHGMKAEEDFTLNIQVLIQKADQNAIGLWVTDNGKGLFAQSEGKPVSDGREGYGLINVKQRLQLNFGEDARFRIYNNEKAAGATAYLQWPMREIAENGFKEK